MDHDGAEGGLRQVLEEPGEEEDGRERQQRGDGRRHLGVSARGFVGGALGEAAVDGEALEQPGGDVRRERSH